MGSYNEDLIVDYIQKDKDGIHTCHNSIKNIDLIEIF